MKAKQIKSQRTASVFFQFKNIHDNQFEVLCKVFEMKDFVFILTLKVLSVCMARFFIVPINVLCLYHHQAGDTNLPICFFSSPVNLTYDVFDGKGESTPLVFLHGLFGSKSNFHSIAKSLVQRTGRKVMQC